MKSYYCFDKVGIGIGLVVILLGFFANYLLFVLGALMAFSGIAAGVAETVQLRRMYDWQEVHLKKTS